MRLIMVVSFSAGWAGLSEGADFRGRGTPGAAEGGGSWGCCPAFSDGAVAARSARRLDRRKYFVPADLKQPGCLVTRRNMMAEKFSQTPLACRA